MKQHRELILICDGYDESQQQDNLHRSNMLNQPGQWNTKMIISCRTQFLGPAYIDRFKPQPTDRYDSGSQDVFQEVVIAPFSKDQVKSYVERYARDPKTARLFRKQSVWSAEKYMATLTAIPNIMDLVKNPFLLTLSLKALPGLVALNKDLASIRITRVRLYDMFVDQWLETNRLRIQPNKLSQKDLEAYTSLMDDDFIGCGISYLLRLAAAIFKEQDGNPIVQYVHRQDRNSWKAHFFGTDPEAKLLREASPLTRTGNQFRFVHRSVLEYLLSRVIYNPVDTVEGDIDPESETASPTALLSDCNNPLFQKNLLAEPSIIQFLCDRVNSSPNFEKQLRAVIDQSKTDPNAAVAATNAITILNSSDVRFHGADFRDIKVPGADLSDGQFDSAQFQGADLRGVNFSRSWLRKADMSGAQMKGVQFGELPYLEMEGRIHACAYSPDGTMLAVAVGNVGEGNEGVGIDIYNTSSWTRIHLLTSSYNIVLAVAFSPDGKRIVSGGGDYLVKLWNSSSGREIVVMKGHQSDVNSVTFSPCGKQVASAGYDKTVRVWDSETGARLLVLEGHTGQVRSVKYSPDGERLVSGSEDKTIRYWNSTTGEPGVVLRTALGEILCLAYSPDGQWIVSGHADGDLHLWNTLTSEPGPNLQGHPCAVNEVTFSPNGQSIASTGVDETVRLWDASTGALLSLLSGHSTTVNCVAFSPDGFQIASGGDDEKVHLWETNLSSSSFEVQCHLGPVWKVVYSPDGRTIFSVSDHKDIRQWDSLTGAPGSHSFKFPRSPSVQFIALSPNCQQVAAAANDSSIRLWSLQTGATGGLVLRGHTGPIFSVTFSPCCRWIVSSDTDKTVWFWDLDNPDRHHVLSYLKRRGSLLAVSPDGLKIASPSDVVVCLFDRQSGDILASLNMEDRLIQTLVFSPTGQQLAIGAGDKNTIKLWNLHPDQPAVSLEGHTGRINCIAYSPCGKWIASGGDDKSVRVWRQQQPNETESWSCVSVVRGFFAIVGDIAWNPAVPMEFVTACQDGSVRVWRVSTGEGGGVVVRQLWGPNFRILCAADMILRDAIGLSSTNKDLLTQRGAV